MEKRVSETIQIYQTNFQHIPPIVTENNEIFLNNANLIKQVLKNTDFIQTKFKTKIDKFVSRLNVKGIDNSILITIISKIFDRIQLFTNKDLLTSITNGVEWIRKMFLINGEYQKWGLLTENLYRTFGTYKSPEWIASISWNLFGDSLKPYCVTDIDKQSTVFDLYENYKIQHFIMFDDGAYSGIQKSNAIFVNTWNELTKSTKQTAFTIILVIPFLTRNAIEQFRITSIERNLGFTKETINTEHNYCQWSDETKHRNVFIWGGSFVMQNTSDIVYNVVHQTLQPQNNIALNVCKDVYNFMINKIMMDGGGILGAALCLFEHKIPDYVSFPVIIADEFYRDPYMINHYRINPPYKYQISINPDRTKVFECSNGTNGGKINQHVMYCNKKYKVLISTRGNKYILHKNRKVYLKSIL